MSNIYHHPNKPLCIILPGWAVKAALGSYDQLLDGMGWNNREEFVKGVVFTLQEAGLAVLRSGTSGRRYWDDLLEREGFWGIGNGFDDECAIADASWAFVTYLIKHTNIGDLLSYPDLYAEIKHGDIFIYGY